MVFALLSFFAMLASTSVLAAEQTIQRKRNFYGGCDNPASLSGQ